MDYSFPYRIHSVFWAGFLFLFLWYEYPDFTASTVLHVRWGIDINVALNRQLLTRLSVQLKLDIEHCLCGHMTLLISHTCIFIKLYNYHYIFWHSTVSGILSCKILLHVSRQFTVANLILKCFLFAKETAKIVMKQ